MRASIGRDTEGEVVDGHAHRGKVVMMDKVRGHGDGRRRRHSECAERRTLRERTTTTDMDTSDWVRGWRETERDRRRRRPKEEREKERERSWPD